MNPRRPDESPRSACADCGAVHPRCTAHKKRIRPLQPCMRWPAAGDAVCHAHGGKSLRGAASPSFKHGRYSSTLKTLGLDRRYQERIRDPQLARLQHYLAFLDARHEQLLEELARGPLPTPEAIQQQIAVCRAAVEGGDWDRIAAATNGLEELVEKRGAAALIWREVYKVGDLRRKAAAVEALTLGRLKQFMTVEQAEALNMAVYHSVNTAVLALVQELGLDRKYHQEVMSSIGKALRRLLSDSRGTDVVLN